jgi:hypothetical protein
MAGTAGRVKTHLATKKRGAIMFDSIVFAVATIPLAGGLAIFFLTILWLGLDVEDTLKRSRQ